MVDYFWDYLISLKTMAILTGFNAVQKKKFGKETNYSEFNGYDLKWLTARTTYKFTPNNMDVKISS
jgi:hypothetical protein